VGGGGGFARFFFLAFGGGGLKSIACCQNILFVCRIYLPASNIPSVAYVLRVLLSECYWSFLLLAHATSIHYVFRPLFVIIE